MIHVRNNIGILVGLLAVILVSGLSGVGVAGADTRVVRTDRSNVRSGPGLDYRVVGQLGQGDAVEVVARQLEWVQIRATGSSLAGWLHESLLALPAEPGGSGGNGRLIVRGAEPPPAATGTFPAAAAPPVAAPRPAAPAADEPAAASDHSTAVKTYYLGPRDVVSLVIFAGGEKQQEAVLTVSNEGTVNIPLIGTMAAAGKTPSQLERDIAGPMARDYFVDPQIHVAIKEYHSLQYSISGAVRKPGNYEMSTETTLIELIAQAGGVLPERGKVAYILRDAAAAVSAAGGDISQVISSREPIRVDLPSLLDRGDMGANLTLQPGDVVHIPLGAELDLGESKIMVEGQIKTPGVYSYQPGMTALNACIMAGGFTRYSAPNRATVIRQNGSAREVIKIDLDRVKSGKQQDLVLEPGDLIQIPETWL